MRMVNQGLRVLLVEDDLRVRDVLAAYLEVDGCAVTQAADGLEGLQKARAERPELIVTDIMMPRLDGLAMVRQMRADPDLSDIPILLVSGHAEPPNDLDFASNKLSYIAKPVTLGCFLAAVRRLRQREAAG
ncbi:MAG: response regulator [Fimbriimonadaceae bacterium]|nr:response regulator [Fimbriimonadaceae bacterium]